jgi:hypothetical protein
MVQKSPKSAPKDAEVRDIRDGHGNKVHRIKPKRDIAYFEFQLPDDDTVHKIPYMQFLTIEQIKSLEEEESITGVLSLFGGDPATIAAIESLNGEQLEDLMGAWRDASSLGLGES